MHFATSLNTRGQKLDRIHGAGEEKHRHDDKVHNNAEAFVILIKRRQQYAEGSNRKREDCTDQEYPDNLQEAEFEADKGKQRQYNNSLRSGKEHAAHGLADNNREPGNRRNKDLLHKAEFLVPDDRDRRKYGTEEDRHSEDARER